MNYSDFIEEISHLLVEASSLFDKGEIDRDPAFRKWRHSLTAALDTIESQDYDIKCRVEHRRFTVGGYSDAPVRMRRYNQDLQDTINELETIIKYFNDYGAPNSNAASKIGSQPQKELVYPQKVTLTWMAEHAPISLWLKLLGILITVFLLGLGFSQTVAYENIQQLWQQESSTDTSNKSPNKALNTDSAKSAAPVS